VGSFTTDDATSTRSYSLKRGCELASFAENSPSFGLTLVKRRCYTSSP